MRHAAADRHRTASGPVRASTTLLAPNPRRMLWQIDATNGFASAIRKVMPWRLTSCRDISCHPVNRRNGCRKALQSPYESLSKIIIIELAARKPGTRGNFLGGIKIHVAK